MARALGSWTAAVPTIRGLEHVWPWVQYGLWLPLIAGFLQSQSANRIWQFTTDSYPFSAPFPGAVLFPKLKLL